MTKKEFDVKIENDKIRELMDLSDSKIHINIIFNKDDLLPYLECVDSINILKHLNGEQISAILGITMGFIQELIKDKSDGKVLLELTINRKGS